MHRRDEAGAAPYRAAGERAETYEEGATARFQVRHRSWTGLAAAGTVGIGALALAVVALSTDRGAILAAAGMLSPAVLLGFALYLVVGSASEVDLRVTTTADRSAVRVVLRRRWGFFPWASPLVFTAEKAPTLETTWVVGRASSKSGLGRRFEHASLLLRVGSATIRLPTMRGPRTSRGEVDVVDHAPSVVAARAEYDEGLARVRADIGKAKREAKRRPTAEHSSGSAYAGPSSSSGDPPTLVSSRDGAWGRAAWVGVGAAIVLPTALAQIALSLAPTRLGLVCGALVVPLFAGIVGAVATATHLGRTLQLRRAWAGHASITELSDLFLFGPRMQAREVAHTLEDGFDYRIDRVEGEDESASYALVVVATGRELTRDAEEESVRRYGNRLGGREIGG